jgi:arsenical pump membrane protein
MGAAPTAIAILIITLYLVITKPQGIGIGWSALGGAIFALGTGVVTLKDIPVIWAMVGNATFTLVALIIISLVLESSGFFRWLAINITGWGSGWGRLLFMLVVLLGALLTAMLTSYGTVLFLTPVVIEIVLELGFAAKGAIAFIIAIGFIADTASLALPVSNLVNTIAADYFHISFLRYVMVMVPCNVVAIATSLGVLWFYFDRYIPKNYSLASLKTSSDRLIRDPLVCSWSFPILGLLLISYFFAQPLGVPVSFIASIGAIIMLALAGRWFGGGSGVSSTLQILQQAPWQVILFSLGMYIVVMGLVNVGLTPKVTHILEHLPRWGITVATTGTGFLAMLLSSVMNHLPAVLINNIAIKNTAGVDPAIREAMVYANIIGCDIGAKLTPIGSLSTLLWLEVLARKGIRINWVQYFSFSIVLTIPVLFISLLILAIWLPWLIA